MVRIANVAADGSASYGPRLCDWLRERCPDIVTLQKTGSKLPAEDLRKMGYGNAVLASARPYLGVAVLTRRDQWLKQDVQARDLPGAEGESRFLTVDIGGLRVSSVYAPFNPKSLGKRAAIERRIARLNRLRDHVDDQGYVRRDSLLCGDFNVKFRADGPRGLVSEISRGCVAGAPGTRLRRSLSQSASQPQGAAGANTRLQRQLPQR